MMGVRKLLDLVFSNNELKILDDILPEFKRHEQLNIEEEQIEVGDHGNWTRAWCFLKLKLTLVRHNFWSGDQTLSDIAPI